MTKAQTVETPWGPVKTRYRKPFVIKVLRAALDGDDVPDGVSRKAAQEWCRSVGIKGFGVRVLPKTQRVGVTWRTLERYEKQMPFQEAMDKVLREFCGNDMKESFEWGMPVSVGDGKRRAA